MRGPGLKVFWLLSSMILLGLIAAGCAQKADQSEQAAEGVENTAESASNELPPLIPREVLFGNPERTSPRLSPDGRMLAYLAPDEGVLNLWVRTTGLEDDRPVTRDRGRGIRGYFWARDNEHLLYIQDRDGDENWHVYSIPMSGGDATDLTPIDGVQAQIVAVEEKFPHHILVGLNDRNPQLHDVYKVDIRNGERELVARNDIVSLGWIADHEFNVRLAQVPTPAGGFRLLYRPADGGEWTELLAWGPEDALTTQPVGFAADNRTLYMINSIGSNTAEFRTYDVETGEERTVASDPHADVAAIELHPTTYEAQAVAFNKDRVEWKILDDSIRDDFEALDELHAGDFFLSNRDLPDDTWLVAYTQDVGPVVYYAFDRASKEGTFLFSARPELDGLPLSRMRPVSYKARDGLTIHGYLTLPVGVPEENLPTVINVHGGPWYRDSWGYNGEAQWFANRGYATLQINFRGSTGYGKDFLNAGNREWGGKMQDDITDGVQWLIERGISDADRIAIYGGSYGGFAVLSGLTKTPELYACGVDIVGPSNILTWMKTIPPYWKPLEPVFWERVGHPEKDAEFLESRSPLFMVDRIEAPLLIAQGANDPRVPKAESIQLVDALKKAGKTVEYVEFPNEGHGFARPENRLRFYGMAEEFLAKYIGGRYEPVAQ